MPDLELKVESARAVPHAAAPCLALALRIANRPAGEEIASIALQCQVRITPAARRYSEAEQAGLAELFGEPERWGRTVPPSLLWANAQVAVPAFQGECAVELPLPCTYDFNVAGTKYFHALEGGEVPLLLLFSGTVFFRTGNGALQISPVPWTKEAPFRLPVRVWKDMMELYYPNSAVLRLRHDIFDRFQRFKVERGLSTFDQAMEALLADRVSPGGGGE